MLKRVALLFVAVSLVVTGLCAPRASAANTQAFAIESFTADYYLSKDNEDRSRMNVREVIVAEFPQIDQNHGIERAVPQDYDNHTVSLNVTSVKKSDGSKWNYSTSSSNGNLVLRIGDANTFVHGKQTYIIDYQLRDVTKVFDTGDELFWDVNGTEWPQPFDVVTARIHVPTVLAGQLTSDMRCFNGSLGSTGERCSMQVSSTAGETVYMFSAANLAPSENLSFVIGFKPATFKPYQISPTDLFIFGALIILAIIWYAVLPIFILVRAVRNWRRYGRDPKGRGTIIPEYVPPRNLSVIDSTVLLHDHMPSSAVSATIIDLAVRHYLKLYEVGDSGLFKSKKYEIEYVKDKSDLRPEERRVVEILFGHDAAVSDRVGMDNLSKTLYMDVAIIGQDAGKRVVENGYMVDSKKRQINMFVWAFGLFAVSLPTFNIPLFFASTIIAILGYFMPARTDKGVVARDYLYGLRDYMKLAEADRLNVLQSPQGAVTEGGVNVGDKAQLVKLYEKVLPYAMVFGIEKQWAEQFAKLYTQPPDWYSGNWATFSAGNFASSLGGITTATADSFASPSSSSSSGFSSGGSSGGGGGGGGGGGW